jgi:hypothetical protein
MSFLGLNEMKGGKDAFGPQIDQAVNHGNTAANQAASYGNSADNFANNYYESHVRPALNNAATQAGVSQYGLNRAGANDLAVQSGQAGLANGKGLAAQNTLYDQAANYNSPEEFERQAALAKGDVGQAEANQQLATQQRANSYGIDPTSGQSQALSAQNQVSNVATEAQAMNNARNAARQLGMQLNAQAAGQANQNVSNAISAGQGVGAAAQGAFGVASGNVNTQNAGASVPLQGKSMGIQASQAAGGIYNSQLSSLASLGNQSLVSSQDNKSNTVNSVGQGIGQAMGGPSGG